MNDLKDHPPPQSDAAPSRGKPGKGKRIFLLVILVLLGLCLTLVAVSVVSNLTMPKDTTVETHLTQLDKARLEEAIHLRQTLGGQILPGWEQADIPIILFNQEYLFLVGYPDPPDGWVKIPHGTQMGKPWEKVPDDDFLGQPYYRQTYELPDGNTQAFTVQIGGRWVASMGTYDFMKVSLVEMFQQELPPLVNALVPYRLMIQLFLPPDLYNAAILHESVHAYQGIQAADRLVAAERLFNEYGDAYPADEALFVEGWQTELDLLARSMQAETDQEAADLVRDFLNQRAKRREAAGLSPELTAMERAREWEEGIAKYGELSSMLAAANSISYQPVDALLLDKKFKSYRGAQQKWNQEIQQIRRMASADGDGRFYYSGFAQAALLDRLYPEWKSIIFDEDVYLEYLLARAVASPAP